LGATHDTTGGGPLRLVVEVVVVLDRVVVVVEPVVVVAVDALVDVVAVVVLVDVEVDDAVVVVVAGVPIVVVPSEIAGSPSELGWQVICSGEPAVVTVSWTCGPSTAITT